MKGQPSNNGFEQSAQCLLQHESLVSGSDFVGAFAVPLLKPNVIRTYENIGSTAKMRTILIALLTVGAVGAVVLEARSGADDLVGSWRLVSAEGHSSSGEVTYEWGQEPLGRLMLDNNGRMSIHLIDPDRPRFASGDFLRPSADELREAFTGYFGYFGAYSVDESRGILTFHVEGAAYPNYIGTDQARFFSIEGTRLTLRTPPERAGGTDITYHVSFERE